MNEEIARLILAKMPPIEPPVHPVMDKWLADAGVKPEDLEPMPDMDTMLSEVLESCGPAEREAIQTLAVILGY